MPALLPIFLEVAALAGIFSGAVESCPEAAVLTLPSLQAAGPLLGVVVLMAGPFPEAAEPAVEPCPEVESFPEAVVLEVELYPGAAALAVPSSEAFESFPEAQLFLEAVALAEFSSEAAGTFLQAGPFPGAAFVAVASLVYVSELQASGNIPALSVFSVPASGLVVEFYSPGHSTLLVSPSVDYYASSASSAAVAGNESVYGPIDDHTNYGPCNVLSIVGLHHNKNSGHYCNTPIPGHNSASDTNDLPMDATTSHSRKIDLQKSRGQRKRWAYQGAQSHPEVRQIRGPVDWRYHTMQRARDRKQYQVPGAVDSGQVQRAAEWGRSFAGWELAQVEVDWEQVRWVPGLGQYQVPLSVD